MNATNPTVPVINVDFLRSGAEFRDAVPISVSGKRVRQDEETAGKSRNRRLDDFYNKTLQGLCCAVLCVLCVLCVWCVWCVYVCCVCGCM